MCEECPKCLRCRDSGWLHMNNEEPEPCPDCTDFDDLWSVDMEEDEDVGEVTMSGPQSKEQI